jgi:hypothetical protein
VIALEKWLNGARPGSKVDIPIFETENVRKKNPVFFTHHAQSGLPRMARIPDDGRLFLGRQIRIYECVVTVWATLLRHETSHFTI